MADIVNSLRDLNEKTLNARVDDWLSSVTTIPQLHIGTITASALATGATKFGGTDLSNLASRLIPTNAFVVKVAEQINKFMQLLSNPNIEGIPIFAASEDMVHNADVAESMVLLQNEDRRRFATDNVVPRPREWTIQGYLKTIQGATDGLLYFKPSVRLQLSMLEAYMESRRPCWYKTHDNKFYKVNIAGLHPVWKAENGNTAVAITIQLKEYNPLILNGGLLASLSASPVTQLAEGILG